MLDREISGGARGGTPRPFKKRREAAPFSSFPEPTSREDALLGLRCKPVRKGRRAAVQRGHSLGKAVPARGGCRERENASAARPTPTGGKPQGRTLVLTGSTRAKREKTTGAGDLARAENPPRAHLYVAGATCAKGGGTGLGGRAASWVFLAGKHLPRRVRGCRPERRKEPRAHLRIARGNAVRKGVNRP